MASRVRSADAPSDVEESLGSLSVQLNIPILVSAFRAIADKGQARASTIVVKVRSMPLSSPALPTLPSSPGLNGSLTLRRVRAIWPGRREGDLVGW